MYRLVPSGIEDLTTQQLNLLARAIFVYKNISLFSTAGSTLLKKIQPLHTNTSLLDELEQPTTQNYESQYLFTYNKSSSTLLMKTCSITYCPSITR